MPAYKAKSRKIRDALVTILQGLTYDAGGGAEPAFALVTGDPSLEFQQEPFALVFPAPILSTKAATGQNDREVQFSLLVLLNMEGGGRTQNSTYNYMYDLTELIMDALDKGDFHDVLNTADPTLGTWLMDSSRGTFLPAETKSGAALLCTIDVSVTYSLDL